MYKVEDKDFDNSFILSEAYQITPPFPVDIEGYVENLKVDIYKDYNDPDDNDQLLDLFPDVL